AQRLQHGREAVRCLLGPWGDVVRLHRPVAEAEGHRPEMPAGLGDERLDGTVRQPPRGLAVDDLDGGAHRWQASAAPCTPASMPVKSQGPRLAVNRWSRRYAPTATLVGLPSVSASQSSMNPSAAPPSVMR